jgi:hypothetical protein
VGFAIEHGFAWIELRDPMASLTLAECKEIAVYAKQRDTACATTDSGEASKGFPAVGFLGAL